MPESSLLNIADVPVALLAGGLATRLRPVTQTIPKAMVMIAGRPFIEHQIELLHRNGIRKLVLCLGHLGEQIQSHVGDGEDFGMEVRYCEDGKKLLGTGGAIRKALPMLGEVFWVTYGDSYMDIDYRAVLEYFNAVNEKAESRKQKAERNLSETACSILPSAHCPLPSYSGLMTVIRNDNCWDRSNAIFRDAKLVRYDKRDRSLEMTYIDYGVQLLSRSAAADLPVDQPSDLADLYRDMVVHGSMVGFEVFQRFYEIGTPESLEETRRYLEVRGDSAEHAQGTGETPGETPVSRLSRSKVPFGRPRDERVIGELDTARVPS